MEKSVILRRVVPDQFILRSPTAPASFHAERQDMLTSSRKSRSVKFSYFKEMRMKGQTDERTIYITTFDMSRLEELLEVANEFGGRNNKHLDELTKELLRAEIVDSKSIPPDVITMNSKVKLMDLDSEEEKTYTLVFPKDADISQNKISILAPIGTALIGFRVGDTIKWQVPAGTRRLKVISILYQPEASGDYHL
jgi:regulator of nucleoside diphosphate kinase